MPVNARKWDGRLACKWVMRLLHRGRGGRSVRCFSKATAGPIANFLRITFIGNEVSRQLRTEFHVGLFLAVSFIRDDESISVDIPVLAPLVSFNGVDTFRQGFPYFPSTTLCFNELSAAR